MKKAIAAYKAVLTLLAAAIVCLSACQPTPEEPAVVNRNDGKIEQQLFGAPAQPGTYDAPAHWKETVEDDKLTIIIDTDVILPDASKYPVVRIEPATFTQERVDELVNYFAQGKKLYLPHVMTKADYEKQIIEAKRGQEVDGEYVVTDESEAWVKELEKKQAAAPDHSPKTYTDTTLTYLNHYETGEDILKSGKNFLDVMVENGNGSDSHISVVNYVDEEGELLEKYSGYTQFSYFAHDSWYITESLYKQFTAQDMPEEETGLGGAGELFAAMTLDRDKSEALAQKTVSELGIEDLVLVRAERSVSPEAQNKVAYTFEFARQSGGIPLYLRKGSGYHKDEQPPQYSPPFTEEMLTIVVSEGGLESFNWIGYASAVETVNENVALLPFDKIQKRLKDQIRYKKSFGSLDQFGMKDNKVTVISAELRMGYIGVKDNLKQALMVPVWVFETEFSHYNTYLEREQKWIDDVYVLNAIDGGVIEERW